jgi:LysM repeat protein
MAEPTCHYCNRPADEECPACGRFYCAAHGEDVCIRCMSPEAAIPSAAVFRGSLLVLVVASLVALFLWIDPPHEPSIGGAVIATETVSEGNGTGPTATPTPSAIASASGTAAANTTAAASATGATTPSASPTPAGNTYTVVEGDTLVTIAQAHNTTVEQIEALNPGLNPNIPPGTVLVMP